MKTDVVIIGAGPVGIFSAFQAGMLGMKSCIIDALDTPGGQCSALYPEKPIYDIPAYRSITAQTLINNLLAQAKNFDPQYMTSRQVMSLSHNDQSFRVITSRNDSLEAKVVLIAAGAGAFVPNRPPLKDIRSYEDKSVFYSITHSNEFAKKRIIVAGGGDSALDWAISLSDIAQVVVIHRRPKFRAALSTVQKIHELAKSNKIKLITNVQLSKLQGKNGSLKNVVVSDLDGNQSTLECDILLPFFGLAQDLGPILDFGLNVTNHHINVSLPHYETSIPGIYAIGDVASYDGKLKLILTGFAEAASALHHAYDRVFDGRALHFEHSTSNNLFKS